MNTPAPTLAEPTPGFRINALTGAATGTSRALSGPLAAEITAALAASEKGEVAVRSVDVNLPLLEKNDILAERNRVIAEGAGACPVACAMSGGAGRGKVVCIVSGGNIDLDKLCAVLSDQVHS